MYSREGGDKPLFPTTPTGLREVTRLTFGRCVKVVKKSGDNLNKKHVAHFEIPGPCGALRTIIKNSSPLTELVNAMTMLKV